MNTKKKADMFPLKKAFCFDVTVVFVHPDRAIKHDIPYPSGRNFGGKLLAEEANQSRMFQLTPGIL